MKLAQLKKTFYFSKTQGKSLIKIMPNQNMTQLVAEETDL